MGSSEAAFLTVNRAPKKSQRWTTGVLRGRAENPRGAPLGLQSPRSKGGGTEAAPMHTADSLYPKCCRWRQSFLGWTGSLGCGREDGSGKGEKK